MARLFNDAVLDLIPVGAARQAAADAVHPPTARRYGWTPFLLSLLTNDDLDNKFVVKITPKHLVADPVEADPVEAIEFVVEGRNSIEDVCATFFNKLGPAKLGPLPLSAVFSTRDDKLIPAGAIMANLYQTHQSENGAGVDLTGRIVAFTLGNLYIISPP